MRRRIATHLKPGPSTFPHHLRIATLTTAVVALVALSQIGVIGAAGPVLTFVGFEKNGVGGVTGLNGANSVTVSPDGKHIYAASKFGSTVAVFSRSSTTGALTFVEFKKDGKGGVDGLAGAVLLTLSPDGKHLYVASRTDNAVAVFSRNSTTGALTFVEAKKDGVGGVDGLDFAYGVTVSPDGSHVYVAGFDDDALAVFSRNSTTGALTFVEFHKDGVGGVDGLNGARNVTVSGDGKHLYVTGREDDTVAVFSRNSTTGALSFVERKKDGVGGVDGLNGADGVTVSPDGKHLYAAAHLDDAVTVFSRNSTTGALTFVEFHKDGVGGVDGLDFARSVTVSPDGSRLFAASSGDDAVTVFSRNSSTGALTFVEFHKDGVGGVDGLDGAFSTTVSPDGKHLYVAGQTDDSVAVFSVAAFDTTPPVITLLGASPIDVQFGSIYTDAGATATDNVDGVLTASIATVDPVDTGVLGTYTVTYDVTDSSGNTAVQVTRTVNVVDTTPPVITLLGASPIDVQFGSIYTDAGATATDNVDGVLTASIATVDPVDTGVLGTYTVTYDVTDSSGNTAVQVTRTVNVVDTTPPVITLLGASPIDVQFGSIYTDAGATATDNVDGVLTASIATVDPVDTGVLGTYTVTYDVTDSSGNAAVQVTRTVNVVGNTPIGNPVVSLPPVTLTFTNVTQAGHTTLTTSGAGPPPPIGFKLVAPPTYFSLTTTAVFDSVEVCIDYSGITLEGQESQLKLNHRVNNQWVDVTVSLDETNDIICGSVTSFSEFAIFELEDTTPPVITLLGTSPVDVEFGSVYADAGATASDNVDGDLTASIVTVNPVNTSALGPYTVTYDVTDSSGNGAVQVTRAVNVVDTTPPVITLLGTSPVDVEFGSVYADAGATASDNVDGDLTASIVTANPVDTGVLGPYTVTYDVTDSSGNAAVRVTHAVNVVDTTPPVIALLGASPVDVEFGSVYADAGATATDNVDGDLTASIVTVNPVNTSALGTYTVTYDVTDSSGNAAGQVTRTVNVVDTTAPVITLLGVSPVDVEFGSVYADAGATASDNVDGDLTASIVTVNPVNTGALGPYTVTYDVTDSSGNAAVQVTRTVNVVDTTPPVITLLGASPVDVEFGSVYTDAGATASDNVDGDLTATIVTANPVDTGALGTYTVTYDVTDSSGNAAVQVTRAVNVVDTTPPVIALLGASPVDVEFGSVYADAGATASDNLDGDLTASIVTANPVDTGALGTYTVTYDVTDSSGNAAVQVTRAVNVVDTTPPVITLLGTSPVDVEFGSVYADAGATASDNVDGDLTASIVTVNPVNTSALGPYTVTYDVTDSSGNAAVQVTRAVNVVDTTPPIITITSPPEFGVEIVGTTIQFSATDDLSGLASLSASLSDGSTTTTVISGFAPGPGVYTLTVTATDLAGNEATESRQFVIYDPAAGFATGGGWIIPGGTTSDAGDDLPGLDNSSKATFGFVVKYKNGATQNLIGQLEFQYRVGSFNLHSVDYEWLVVTNSNWAKFQGLATIDGSTELYPFRVDARDGDANATALSDRFVIKIWAVGANPDTDEPIYKGSGDLGGGKIKIHE